MKELLKLISISLIALLLAIKTITSGNIEIALKFGSLILFGLLFCGLLLLLLYKVNFNLFKKILNKIGFITED